MRENQLTRDQVLRELSYDCDTGVFTRLKPRSCKEKEAKEAGYIQPIGYRAIYLASKKRMAHRLAWLIHYGVWPTGVIDHINGDRADNRICNLRDVTNAENMQNQKRATRGNRTSGLLGVTWSKKQMKWVAEITVYGKPVYLGAYPCKFEAYDAYIKAKREMHPASTL